MKPSTITLSPLLATKLNERGGSIWRRLVMQAMVPMTKGCLLLELPDGTRRWFGRPEHGEAGNVRVKNWDFFKRCALYGDVGFGEAYMDGSWDTDDITKVISWFILNVEKSPGMSGTRARRWLLNFLGWQNRMRHKLRPNSVTMSRQNIAEHYDLGNDFYRLFLDATMTYSSALFSKAGQTLEAAQIAKYDRLCRQLNLKAQDHLLEIGSGWDGFSVHAAKNYGCRITTVTISEEQFKYARERFKQEGVNDRVDIQLLDYRNIKGQFDKIVSIEMLEAVGDKYLETYFAKCQEVLKPQGLLAVQMITCPDTRHDELKKNVDWIQKHIFPGSLLLSVHRVNEALRHTGDLFLHDLKDLGQSYAETLRRWRTQFNAHETAVRDLGFDTRFIRKWNYYLAYCEAAFAMRNISVVQAVYTRPNNSSLINL